MNLASGTMVSSIFGFMRRRHLLSMFEANIFSATNVPYEPLSRQKARRFQNPQEILGIVEISCKLSDLCRNMSILSFCFLNEVNSLNLLEGSHLMS